MATILTPVPTNRPDFSSRISVSLVGGLATLIFSFIVLSGGTVLPTFKSHPVIVPAEAAVQTAAAPDDAGYDATGLPRSPGHLLSTVNRLTADRPSPAPTTAHLTGANVETTLARGTRAESAHLATIVLKPDGRDVRWDLMEMAAAQRRDWTVRCPCPVYPIDVPPGDPR
jgi:hypothetical protein